MKQREFELYDRLEKEYWWYKARRNILRVYLDCIPEKELKSALEIGCGTGGNLRYLFSSFQSRVGLDYDREALKYACIKVEESTYLVQGDANSLPICKESVDCVALLDVLYHKAIHHVEDILWQVNTLLKPGGYILITDGAFNMLQGTHNATVHAARRFTRKELVSLLQRTNYEMMKSSYWGIVLFVILFFKRAILEKILPALQNSNQFDFVSIPFLDRLIEIFVTSECALLKFSSLPFGASVAILARKSIPK